MPHTYFIFSHHFVYVVSFDIIKHSLTVYSGNSKSIDPLIPTIARGVGISASIDLLFPSYPVNKYKIFKYDKRM